ncbi:MAG: septal ring lytic transglycosylase RlpA family protein [Methylacidiphilales bacterium]|nr:septal ring lytic transglycosylase RlpA family protein [Candidatus Methylacidiphilales bacterium]NJR20016.1 septal ring lytic transglycosylase RlpA family protein [Calothrix sp. CSU_2_0]
MLISGFFSATLLATSWAASLLSLIHNLPPSGTAKFSTPKLSSNLGKLAILPQRKIAPIRATVLPIRFFNIDWDNKEPKEKQTQISHQTKAGITVSNNQFCSALKGKSSEQEQGQAVSFVTSSKLIDTNTDKFSSNNFSNQILLNAFGIKLRLSLQNFFRLPSPFESRLTTSPLPATLVRRDETSYEVWVNNQLIASLSNQAQAKEIQRRLNKLLKSPTLDPSQLRPSLVDGKPALMAGNRFLFGIGKEITDKTTRSGDLIAIDWVNNLRSALKVPPLSLVQGQMQMYGLEESNQRMEGVASWYGDYFHGRTTANGETYNQYALTVAHKTLPFNTYLEVKNVENGQSVVVRVNDRGPYIHPRSLDLSLVAARCVGGETAGIVNYEAKILQPSQPLMTLNAALVEKERNKPRQMSVIPEF